jgi:hypothetical protein
VERETTALGAVCGAVVLGGCARMLSWRQAGRPHPAFAAATAVEFAVPALLLWQRRVAALAEVPRP